ncbi:hypothetical protein ACVBEH_32960, partial [Roseateles sp. GG27B]
GLYPSPLDAAARQSAAHSRFMVGKLDALIRAFALPTDVETRITPSCGDGRPLEAHAIPWYYRSNSDARSNANA